MITYICCSLIMGNVKVDKDYYFCLNFEFIFTEIFIEKSSTFRIAFVQIVVFDWLPG